MDEEEEERVSRGVRRSEVIVIRRAKEVGLERKVEKAEWRSSEAGGLG